ncbi:hypothetical protein AC625_08905 [Peribacillus loiseleuriae]|uniref:Uncharacterized protein n=1 Tax=Peribacillus loiseleuriae TaxID=1679170 RepID=A0A0K9GTP1_9BACI|nr:hypothetical protein AC625_08905 [Peribacillus loiseleuriae]
MHYPTVLLSNTNEMHIVKDEQTCICGEKYNYFSTFTRSDLRKIKFKKLDEVDCPLCKVLFKNDYQV